MNLFEKQIEKQYLYNGKIINVRKDKALLPDGKLTSREVVEHPGGVGVIAVTEKGEILLVKQFRYPYGELTLEIPAGKRDKGEEPFITGQRELREETGAVAETFISLGYIYPTPGYCNEIIYIYAAKDLKFGETDFDDGEFLECEKVPFDTAVKMVMSGEIKDSKTAVAILKLKLLKDENKF